MVGLGEVPRPNPEISLRSEEASTFMEAAGRLVSAIDFVDPNNPDLDQWKSKISEEDRREAGGDFLREFLGLRGWHTVEGALDEQSGIRFTEDNQANRLRVRRLAGFLERQGITEEVLEEKPSSEPPAVPGREVMIC